jgi:hypothetical protein
MVASSVLADWTGSEHDRNAGVHGQPQRTEMGKKSFENLYGIAELRRKGIPRSLAYCE